MWVKRYVPLGNNTTSGKGEMEWRITKQDAHVQQLRQEDVKENYEVKIDPRHENEARVKGIYI